jgi:hypothetical protein
MKVKRQIEWILKASNALVKALFEQGRLLHNAIHREMSWRISGRVNRLDFHTEFPSLEDVSVLILLPLGYIL